MTSSHPAPDHSKMRISDRDRDQAAEVIRTAAGDGRLELGELEERLSAIYAAKTYADLAPVLADLPHSGTAHPPAVTAPAQPAAGAGQPGHDAVAIMGSFQRTGSWPVPATMNATAIVGGGEIDFREARFTGPSVTIHATAICGGIEIIVPEDAEVQVSGIGICGGFDHRAAGPGKPGAPSITITGAAICGGVEVRRLPPGEPGHLGGQRHDRTRAIGS